jgi:aminoglycoside phosphotransferase (APT) family kinase protein
MSDELPGMNLDLERLAAWMDERDLPGKGEPVKSRFLSGGTQNHIYELCRGDDRCVIRIPPPQAPADRDRGILREWRIIDALDGSEVPHTRAVAVCEDPSVLGRTFYLMGYVDGWSPAPKGSDEWPEPFRSDLSTRADIAFQMIEGLARLSRFDWQGGGLSGFGRPEGFHARQVDRWTSLFQEIKVRELDGMDVVTAWLRAHSPHDYVPGLMHGDYAFSNVMFQMTAPARLGAIVDWEMGTIGDPKLDLAWLLGSWPEETSTPDPTAPGIKDMRGMPGQSRMLAYYAEASGRQVEDFDYYVILARFKAAIVLERGFARAGDDPKLQSFGPTVARAMKDAAELAETTDYRG